MGFSLRHFDATATVLIGIRQMRERNIWSMGDWLVNYQGGFAFPTNAPANSDLAPTQLGTTSRSRYQIGVRRASGAKPTCRMAARTPHIKWHKVTSSESSMSHMWTYYSDGD